jgi:dihydroflavonol-4-reductase
MSKVLLTGISGFVGQHCAVELLKKGYAVRGSVRQLTAEKEVRHGIAKEVEEQNLLEFCQLNLLSDEGCQESRGKKSSIDFFYSCYGRGAKKGPLKSRKLD